LISLSRSAILHAQLLSKNQRMQFLHSLRLRHAIPVGAILLGCLLIVFDPASLQTLRHGVFDQYQRWYPRPYQDAGVRIVDVDEESLKRIGQWPWSRARIAELVAALKTAGTDTIAFDMLFAEPDRTSPAVLQGEWQLPREAAAQIAALPEPDHLLAHAMDGGKVVLGFAEAAAGNALPPAQGGLLIRGAEAIKFLPSLSGTVSALPVLANAAAGNGAITFRPDTDGIVRRIPLLLASEQTIVPSLVTETLRVSNGATNLVLHTDAAGAHQIDIGPLRIPTSADAQFWLHFSREAEGRTVPAWRVLTGDFSPDGLKGALVIVGASAQGLQDLRFSPLGGVIPGVEMHAQALEQIKLEHWLQRPSWSLPVEALSLLIGSLALGLFALRSGALLSAIGACVFLLMLNGVSWLLFRHHFLLVDMVTPSLGILSTYVFASVSRHMNTEAKQRWIQQAFARYVSPNRVAHLMANPQALALGGQRQTCSFVFTDLTNFTELVESNDPQQVVAHMNSYLEGLIQIAFRHEGTLDRIVGDALAIMFSAPIQQPDHPARALRCALEMQEYAEQHAAILKAQNFAFGITRIGVHCGDVVVGNFGGKTIFDYRAMGDAVNITARLESLNRHLGTTICVSDAIREASPHIAMRKVGNVQLKGKRLSVAVYEPITHHQLDPDYDAAYAMLANADPMAEMAFAALHVIRPMDGLVAFQLKRLQAGESGEEIRMAEK